MGLVFNAEGKRDEPKNVVPRFNARSFDAALESQKYVLVNFFAPWCGHCKVFAPEFDKVAVDSSAVVASVDAVSESELTERYDIKEYPTVLLVSRDGTSEEYTGERSAASISRWVSKRIAPSPAVRLESVDDAEQFLKNHPLACIAFVDDGSAELATVVAASLQVDDVVFAYLPSRDGAAKLGAVLPSLRVQAPHAAADASVFQGSLGSPDEIATFVRGLRLPPVVPFDGESSVQLFGDGRPILFLFRGEDAVGEAAEQELTKAASCLRSRFPLSTVKLPTVAGAEDYAERLAEFVGVHVDALPSAILLEDPMASGRKFRPEGSTITRDALCAMEAAYSSGTLSRFVKSEALPSEATGSAPVAKLVGLSMEEAVMDETKDVVVLVCVEWHGVCQRLRPVWNDLASHFAGVDTLRIATIDAAHNDLHDTEVGMFPMIRLWQTGQKTSPQDYSEEREKDFDSLAAWLVETTGAAPVAVTVDPSESEL